MQISISAGLEIKASAYNLRLLFILLLLFGQEG